MDKVFKIPSFDDFKQVADEIISNLYNVEIEEIHNLSEDDIKHAKTEIKKIILESNFDFDTITAVLESRQYSENKVSYLISSLKQRKSELLVSTLVDFNTAYGETVQDIEWLLKLIIGTSELKTMRYPLLQLLFLTVTKTGNKYKRVYDISKDMLDKIITIIEEAIKI